MVERALETGASLRCNGTPAPKLISPSKKERWLVGKKNRRKCEKAGRVLGQKMALQDMARFSGLMLAVFGRLCPFHLLLYPRPKIHLCPAYSFIGRDFQKSVQNAFAVGSYEAWS